MNINLDGISQQRRKELYGNKPISQIGEPSESQIQMQVFEWAKYNEQKYPELKLLYHIPNEGKRTLTTGAKLKREGLRAGVPDICLPCANSEYNALYIELKAMGKKPTANQKVWMQMLNGAGNLALICYGFDEVITTISKYLGEK